MAGGKRWVSTAALWRRVQSPNALFDQNDKVSNLKKNATFRNFLKIDVRIILGAVEGGGGMGQQLFGLRNWSAISASFVLF
jgi:hypothetical protein